MNLKITHHYIKKPILCQGLNLTKIWAKTPFSVIFNPNSQLILFTAVNRISG